MSKLRSLLERIPVQVEQRRISAEQAVTEMMIEKSRIKEMPPLTEVGNLFLFFFSRHSGHIFGADLLFDG